MDYVYRIKNKTHEMHIRLGLQKRNKDFQTLHEQANKLQYNFKDLSLSPSNSPTKLAYFFFVECKILQIIFKFHFSQYACLCEIVGDDHIS